MRSSCSVGSVGDIERPFAKGGVFCIVIGEEVMDEPMSVPSEGVTVTVQVCPLEINDEETEVESSNVLTIEESRFHLIVVPDSESPSGSEYVYVRTRESVVVGDKGSITKLDTDGAC